jgi:hypothetical protein
VEEVLKALSMKLEAAEGFRGARKISQAAEGKVVSTRQGSMVEYGVRGGSVISQLVSSWCNNGDQWSNN